MRTEKETVKLDFKFDSIYNMHEISCQNESGASHQITHLDGIVTIYLDAIMNRFNSYIGRYPIIILTECVNVHSDRIIVFFFYGAVEKIYKIISV